MIEEDRREQSSRETVASIRNEFAQYPLDIRVKMYRVLAWAWGWEEEYFWVEGKPYTTKCPSTGNIS